MQSRSAIVIGAGIVGLATARALALRGFAVKVFERSDRAVGASIRNFGMIWPIGQTTGKMYDRAIRSRNIWTEIAQAACFFHEKAGSLHVAYHPDEWQVLQELYEVFQKEGRSVRLLDKAAVVAISAAVVPDGLLGGLHSMDEMIVDPREAIAALPGWLSDKFQVDSIGGNACLIFPIRPSISAMRKSTRRTWSLSVMAPTLKRFIRNISPGCRLPNANCR
jgi:FAD dependent oxidoreductase TIGR03364